MGVALETKFNNTDSVTLTKSWLKDKTDDSY